MFRFIIIKELESIYISIKVPICWAHAMSQEPKLGDFPTCVVEASVLLFT